MSTDKDRTAPEPEPEPEPEPDGEPREDDAPSAPSPTFTELLRDYYLTLDRRTLGFARLLLGFYLITDLLRRTWSWEDMFSTIGVLPNHVNLWRPQGSNNFSILNAFSTPGELWVLWALILATYVGLLVGWKTKVMQVLSLLWVTSMNGRVLQIENGGYVVQNLLLLWTCFLPLGDRFSLDALLASLKRHRERTAGDLNDRSAVDDPDKPDALVTAASAIILLQLAAIYFFNFMHKTGPAWRNGSAVHYVLYVDRMVTPLIGQVRDHLPNWMIVFMTKTTLAFELAIPVCLLSPLARPWARRFSLTMMNALHIAFGVVFVLGPFAWALCIFSVLLLGRDDWEIAIETMRRAHRARVVLFDPRSPGALLACRVLKRMDRFELLTFERARRVHGGLAVRAPSGARLTGALALADALAALPAGPVIAWALRLPGVSHGVTALMDALHARRAGRALGLRLPVAAELAPPPAPLRRAGWKALAVTRELLVCAMFVGAVNQAAVELWVVNRRIRVPQPEPLRTLSHKLRFLQGWFMFSPNPVMDDGTIVVDAVTVDGRHIDPFTNEPPDFNLLDAKSLGYNQIWSDYFNRMHMPSNTPYREAMKEYLFRYPERTGRPGDTIVSGDVYWVKDWNPKWNQTESYDLKKDKLFSFHNPKAGVPRGQPPQGAEMPEDDPTPHPPGTAPHPPTDGPPPGQPNLGPTY